MPMSGPGQTGRLTLGGALAVMDREVLDGMGSVNASLSAIGSQLSGVVDTILNSLNSVNSILGTINKQISDALAQLSSVGSQLVDLLNQAVSAHYGLLRRTFTVAYYNTLDQPVTVELVTSLTPSFDGAFSLWSYSISPGGSSVDTFSSTYFMNLSYFTVRVKCNTAPTTGYVRVVIAFADGSQDVIINNLEIRDTNPHDASTDPDKIKWVKII